MSLDDLFENPDRFRIRDNFRASHIVFPVNFGGKRYIVKKTKEFMDFINIYYWFQDLFFYGSRIISVNCPDKGLEEEARKLKILEGVHSPKMIGYREGVLVREFCEGEDFRSIRSDKQIQTVLEEGMAALEQIHGKGVIVGDTNVKNLFDDHRKGVIWFGMSGVFKESPMALARARDVVKFVYSTYTITRNRDMTFYAAEIAARYKGAKEGVRNLVDPGLSSLRLWFPTRIPFFDSLNRNIKKILRS